MANSHVVKMILEYAQLLSTAHHILSVSPPEGIYKKTHINHPMAIWTRECAQNYAWLYKLFELTLEEYTFRYSKIHATSRLLPLLANLPENIYHRSTGGDGDYYPTNPPLCMPDEYKSFCVKSKWSKNGPPDYVVNSYRKYYITAKSKLLKIKNRKVPEWWM